MAQPILKAVSALLPAAGALAVGVWLWAAPAAAQYNDQTELFNRLSRLETEVQTLERQLYRGGGNGAAIAQAPAGGVGVAPTQAADFEIRLSQLERTVQEMVGKYEEAVFGATQQRERLDKLSSDLDYRLSQIESRLGTEGGPAPGPRPSTQAEPPPAAPAAPPHPTAPPHPSAPPHPAAPPHPGAPPAAPTTADAGSGPGLGSVPEAIQQQYDEAFGLLRKADYDQAERALSRFVTQHRDSPLAGNAQYWLGETYYGRGKYAEAAVAFAEGFQKYPKSPKASDDLLKLGMSLAALNQKADACKTFGQLGTLFPNAAASVKRRAEQERGKLGCP
jgi:tol-pal system protein YbgF